MSIPCLPYRAQDMFKDRESTGDGMGVAECPDSDAHFRSMSIRWWLPGPASTVLAVIEYCRAVKVDAAGKWNVRE